jgi:hypothetical protein
MPINIENDFNKKFQTVILENCVMLGGLGQTLSP